MLKNNSLLTPQFKQKHTLPHIFNQTKLKIYTILYYKYKNRYYSLLILQFINNFEQYLNSKSFNGADDHQTSTKILPQNIKYSQNTNQITSHTFIIILIGIRYMRRTPIPTKRTIEIMVNKPKKRDSQSKLTQYKLQKVQRRTPSKSPSLQPYSRSISRDSLSGRLSFNKHSSKNRHELSNDVVNTKEHTFITHEQSSHRSILQADEEGRKSRIKSGQKLIKKKFHPQKSFFNSLQSKIQRKSASKLQVKKKVKNKNTLTIQPKKKQQKIKKLKKPVKKQQKFDKPASRIQIYDHVKVNENRENSFQQNRLRFQKKITQVSEQQLQCTIGGPRSINNGSFHRQTFKGMELFNTLRQTKKQQDPNKVLHNKIKQKVHQTMPALTSQESILLISIIFIQRSWRQKKVKKIIGNFLTPKQQTPRLQIIPQTLIPSNESTPYQLKIPKTLSPEIKLFQFQESKKKQSRFLQKIERSIQKFTQNVPLKRTTKKYSFLNLASSVSETCLADKINKRTHLIDTRVDRLKQAKAKLMFNRTNPVVDIEITNVISKQITPRIAENKEIQIEEKQQKVSQITQLVIKDLFNELYGQKVFSRGKKQEKKNVLPKIKTSRNSINKYLSQLINYIDSTDYRQIVINNLNKPLGIKPQKLLKFLRFSESDQQLEEEFQDEQDEQFSIGPVLPPEIFLQFQQRLQKEQEQPLEKYKNFKEGIQRIYNKSLLDCFSEILDQKRIHGINGKPFPWQNNFVKNHQLVSKGGLKVKMHDIKDEVIRYASFKLGSRYGNDQLSILNSIKDEYQKNQHEWFCLDEQILEVNLQISTEIVLFLIDQACYQILSS